MCDSMDAGHAHRADLGVGDCLALGLAATLLAFDLLAWRVVAAMFDRERLVTGIRG